MTGDKTAAIVDRTVADEALEAIRSAGVYDTERRIEPVDDDRLAIPVTETLSLPQVERFEANLAIDRRLRTLGDHLAAAGWTETELEAAPSSYARIGDIVVVTDDCSHDPPTVGEALLALHRDCAGVVRLRAIEGGGRQPAVEHVAGTNRTHTVHHEHGLAYELDLAEVMFSPGNQRERTRMRDAVSPGERVLDLCAGIGYFAVPMADGGAEVVAIERNPVSFKWLSRNATRNALDHRLTPVCGDCRACPATADRAVVGHLPVHDCRDDPTGFGGGYLDAALRAVDSGWIHVHGIAWAGETDAAGDALCRRLMRRGATVVTWSVRRVKGIAPRTDHIVVDVRVEGPNRPPSAHYV